MSGSSGPSSAGQEGHEGQGEMPLGIGPDFTALRNYVLFFFYYNLSGLVISKSILVILILRALKEPPSRNFFNRPHSLGLRFRVFGLRV